MIRQKTSWDFEMRFVQWHFTSMMVVVRWVRSFVKSVLLLLLVRATVWVGNKEGVQESWFGESATQWPVGWRTRAGRALSCLPKDVWINWELPCCPDHSYVMNLSFTFPRRWDRWLAHRCGELSEIPVAQRHMAVRAGPEDRLKSMRWWWWQVSCLSETNDHRHLSSWIRWSGWQMAVNVYLW